MITKFNIMFINDNIIYDVYYHTTEGECIVFNRSWEIEIYYQWYCTFIISLYVMIGNIIIWLYYIYL